MATLWITRFEEHSIEVQLGYFFARLRVDGNELARKHYGRTTILRSALARREAVCKCGHQNVGGASFCARCGAKMDAAAASSPVVAELRVHGWIRGMERVHCRLWVGGSLLMDETR
jgi:hypothetical protein